MFYDAIGVMLLTHDHYRQFTQRPIGDARRESQAMIALTADSTRRGECDAREGCRRWRPRRSLTRRRISASCSTVSVEDPDGYVWEIMWMDPKGMQ